ncbi:MAG TPA: tetratricopeptide repeat protein [Polyangia bacterium]
MQYSSVVHFQARVLIGVLFAASAAATVVVAPEPAEAAVLSEQDKKAILAKADEIWKKREEPAALAESKRLLDQGLAAAPSDYDFLWRSALWHFWCSDDPKRPQDERIKLAKTGWDIAERAVAVNPAGVQGHFFAAAAMGNYSLGIGILRALAQRIEGKFTGHLREAEKIDPKYGHGGIPLAWGRYYASLPWPKYDKKKATANYQRALTMNPHNVRAKVYWAELLLEEDDPEAAKKLIDEALAAQPGKYDAPEERRAKALAPEVAAKVAAALK